MTVISVKSTVLSAAQTLGISEGVERFLLGEADVTGERDTALLLACFKRVENEVALDYLPLIAEEEVITTTGVITYSQLVNNAVRIFRLEDEAGNSLKYKLFPKSLRTNPGVVKIIYAYAPSDKKIDDVSNFSVGASERMFVYGVVAEYLLAVGDLNGARVWDKKYRAALRAAYRLQPCKRIRSRRWS